MLALKILAFTTSKNTSSDQLFHSRIFELMVEIRLRFAFQIWGRPHWLGDLLQRFWNAVDSVKCETETFWDRSFSCKQTCVVKMKRKMRLKFWAQLDLLLLKVDKTYFFFFFFFFFTKFKKSPASCQHDCVWSYLFGKSWKYLNKSWLRRASNMFRVSLKMFLYKD